MLSDFHTDFTKLPKEIMIDLVNADNGTHLIPEQLNYGTPAPLIGARNTSLVLTAAEGSGYYGSQTVRYNRIDLDLIQDGLSTEFELGTLTSIRDLIPQINARYGVNLTEEDYLDAPITMSETEESRTISLIAKPSSLVYIGSLDLVIVQVMKISLPEVIIQRVLSIFTYTPPTELLSNVVTEQLLPIFEYSGSSA